MVLFISLFILTISTIDKMRLSLGLLDRFSFWPNGKRRRRKKMYAWLKCIWKCSIDQLTLYLITRTYLIYQSKSCILCCAVGFRNNVKRCVDRFDAIIWIDKVWVKCFNALRFTFRFFATTLLFPKQIAHKQRPIYWCCKSERDIILAIITNGAAINRNRNRNRNQVYDSLCAFLVLFLYFLW